MVSQTKYIGIGTTILSITLLLSWFAMRDDFRVELGPNISCMGECIEPTNSDCVEYFNITSLERKFYIKNKGSLDIPFTNPEKVQSFQVYRADKRFRSDNPNRWKPFNFSENFILDVNVTNEFQVRLCKKKPSDDIKWGIEGFGIIEDPIFRGINVSYQEACTSHLEVRYNKTNITVTGAIWPNGSVNSTTTIVYVEWFEDLPDCENVGLHIANRYYDFEKFNIYCSHRYANPNLFILCLDCNRGDCRALKEGRITTKAQAKGMEGILLQWNLDSGVCSITDDSKYTVRAERCDT